MHETIMESFMFCEIEMGRALLYELRDDPLPIIGFLLIGAAGVLWFRVYLAVQSTGEKFGWFWSLELQIRLFRTYLKHARLGRWSPWLVYLIWFCEAFGVLALVVGLLRWPGIK